MQTTGSYRRHEIVLTLKSCAALIVMLLSAARLVSAGECLTSNEELYRDVVNRYKAAKNEVTEDGGNQWGLHCWKHDKRYDAKLKKLLKEMMFDSRIHPADVAAAVRDYETVFGSIKSLAREMKVKQGDSRLTLIDRIVKHGSNGTVVPRSAIPPSFTFSPDIDFINGPATLYKEPHGSASGTLPDNTRVALGRRQGEWFEVAGGHLKGWVKRNSLMGMSVNSTDTDGSTVLSRAAYLGYLETVHFLLKQGAKIDFVDSFGRNAVHWAVMGGTYQLGGDEIEILARLIAAKEGEELNMADKNGNTPLMFAISTGRPELVKILLDNGANKVNIPDKDGKHPLMLAIDVESPEMVKLLLEKGAVEVNATNKDGVPPLSLAIRRDNMEIVTALLNAPNINIDAVDNEGKSPLYHAVASGRIPLMQLLLERKARTDTVTTDGKTLYHAVFASHPYQPVNPETVKLLQSFKDIDINKKDKDGHTALSLAVENKLLPIVKQLLTIKEIDVNSKTCSGGPCLNRVLGEWGDRTSDEIALLLLDRPEIDVNVPDSSGYTAVHMSWYVLGSDYGVEKAKKILARSPNLEVINEHGETPLIHNINQDKPEMVRLLAATKGIDLDNPGRGEITPLRIAELKNSAEIVGILSKAGAQEYFLLGDDKVSPEGVPQTLLHNDLSDEAVRFYRSYLIDTTNETLSAIRAGKTDDAVQIQEGILYEFVAEVASSMEKLSKEQRTLAHKTFVAINNYRTRHPIATNKWFQIVASDIKEAYAQLDANLSAVLAGKFDSLPDGEHTTHPPMVPIIIFRDYMVNNSINALTMLHEGKIEQAEQFMKDVVSRSKSRYVW